MKIKKKKRLGYKGFMHIKCENCGKEVSYNKAEEIQTHFCFTCRKPTELKEEKMKRVHMECECGCSFRYWTNQDAKLIEIECLNCGSPVTMEYNRKKGSYITIKDQ